MKELIPSISQISRLPQEQRLVVNKIASEAWRESMRILSGRRHWASPEDSFNLEHRVSIVNMEALNSEQYKKEGIDLIVQVEGISYDMETASTDFSTQIFYFSRNDGGCVIRKTTSTRKPDFDIHEATRDELEFLLKLFGKITDRKKYPELVTFRQNI